MSGKFIPLSVPNLKGEELNYVTKAIETEWVSTGGKFIDEFETALKDYTHAAGAVACQSGTAGIHLALITAGVGADDIVLVPTLTFIAAVNPVSYVGAEPVFMDCDDSLCMDMDKVAQFCENECRFENGKLIDKLTGKHVKAMIVVHVFGNMADMEKALQIADQYNLTLIEDATEALGTYVTEGSLKGKHAGTIGDVGIYSFNGNKIITTGGGGMIVSNNSATLEKCKYLSTQAKDDTLYYKHDNVGYNYRMTNIQAAVGLAQFDQLESFIETKHRNYAAYLDAGIELLPFRDTIRSNMWFYSYMTDCRDDVIRLLGQRKIQTRPIWNLNHAQKPYAGFRSFRIEKATFYQDHVVNLPCSTNLSRDDVLTVCSSLKEVMAELNA